MKEIRFHFYVFFSPHPYIVYPALDNANIHSCNCFLFSLKIIIRKIDFRSNLENPFFFFLLCVLVLMVFKDTDTILK